MKKLAFLLSILLAISRCATADPPAHQPTPKAEGLAVEKDGASFEIVLSERDWSIPENKPGSSSAFIKLGLRMTNKSDKPLRFNGYDTLWPELVTTDGKEVHRWEGPQATLRHRQPQERDFPLVEPGKTAVLSLQADLFWPTLEHRTLMFRWWHASGSPGRYFDDLKPGAYKVRLVYENQRKSLEVEYPQHKVLDDNVWTGRVVTPFVRVVLRERGKDGLEAPLESQPTATRSKTSMKGWELYIWQEEGGTYFSLLPGTNRLKTDAEIKKAAVKGIEAIKPKLEQLKPGEYVFLRGRRLNGPAPENQAKAVAEYCRTIGLKVQR